LEWIEYFFNLAKKFKWKKSTSPPELWGGVYFTPRTMKQSNLPPELSKIVKIIPWVVFYGGFATVTVVLTFFFPICFHIIFEKS